MRASRLVVASVAPLIAFSSACATTPEPAAPNAPAPVVPVAPAPSPVAATQAATPPALMPVRAVGIAENAALPRIPLSGFSQQTAPHTAAFDDHGIALGSIGSDIFPAEAPDEYWMVTDRGPNSKVKVAKHVKRVTMPTPGFDPSIVRVKLSGGSLAIQQTVPITTSAGAPVTGLANSVGGEGPMLDARGSHGVGTNPAGLDTEGLVRTTNGEFWLSEEYGPSILRVSPTGTVLGRYVPQGTALPDPGYPVFATLPAILGKRQDNRGFESMAISPDGGTLYAAMQSPLGVPTDAAAAGSHAVRLFAFDPATGQPTAEYVYPLESVTAFDRSMGGDQSEMKISALAWYGPNQLLVDERTDNVAKLFVVTIDPARNILGTPFDDPAHRPALEQSAPGPYTPLDKALLVDLTATVPGLPSKIEGVAVRDPRTIVVSNDNDFGIGNYKTAFGPNGRLRDTGDPSRVMVVNLAGQ